MWATQKRVQKGGSQEMWDLWPALAINPERRVSDGDSGSFKCLSYNRFCLSLQAGVF